MRKALFILILTIAPLFCMAKSVQAASVTTAATGTWELTAWPTTTARTGKITCSTSNTAVSCGAGGNACAFTTETIVGNKLYYNSSLMGTIASITDDSHLTLTANCAQTVSAKTGYTSQGVGSGDSVTIAAGHMVTISSGVAGKATSVTIAANSSATQNGITFTDNTSTLTLSSTVTMTAPTNASGTLIAIGAGTLSGTTGITINGGASGMLASMTLSTGTLTMSSGGITFGGTTAQTRFTTTGAATINLVGTFGANGVVSINSGTTMVATGTSGIAGAYTIGKLTVNSGVTLTQSAAVIAAGDVSIISTGILASGANLFTAQANYTCNGTHSGSSGITVSGASAVIDGSGTVSNTGTFTVSGATAANFKSTANITIQGKLLISGAITVTNNGTVTLNTSSNSLDGDNASSNFTNASGSTLSLTGTIFSTNGTLTSTASTNTVDYNGASQAVKATSYSNLTLDGSGTPTIGGTTSVAGTMTVTGITATNNSTLTLTGALSGTGTLDNGASGTLNINFTGSVGITGLTAGTAGNTVSYGYAGTQTVRAISYSNLTLANSGAKDMSSVTTIGGNLTISGSATMTNNAGFTVSGALNYSSSGSTTLTLSTAIQIGTYNQSAGTIVDNANTITVSGTGASTWVKSGGTFTATGLVNFTGAAPQIGASNFYNFTVTPGGGNTATLTGAITVAHTLTIASGILSTGAGSNAINVAGDWTNSGSFTANSGLVTLNGAGGSTQLITGSTTFYDLTVPTGASARIITFTLSTTQVITHALNISGSAGNVITLQSSSSPTKWNINTTGIASPTLTYLSVTDSNSTLCLQPTNSSGSNNTNWDFVGTGCVSNQAPTAPTVLWANETSTGAQSGVLTPVALGAAAPWFSALYQDPDTLDVANYYEIIVYSDASCNTQLWDSTKTSMTPCTAPDRCASINYGGSALPYNGNQYSWKIRYWDTGGLQGALSACNTFTELGPANQLRHGDYFFNNTTERVFTW